MRYESPVDASAAISEEDAKELVRLAEKLAKIDLEKLAEEKERSKTPLDRLAEDLKANRTVLAILSKKGKGKITHSPTCSGRCGGRCGDNHWRVKRRKKRVRDKRYKDKIRALRKAEVAEKVRTKEGWWDILTQKWREKKVEVELTREEFFEVIFPSFYPRVPLFLRYETDKPVSLENLIVRDQETGEYLWDGKEYLLVKMGYAVGREG